MSTLKVKYNEQWQNVGSTGTALTALAENVGILNNKVDAIKVSNPNLLDNGWFTVNQRGITTISHSGSGDYVADRWVSNRVDGATQSDGIHFHHRSGVEEYGYIREILESNDVLGKVCTLSAIVDGVVYSFTETYPSTGSVESGFILQVARYR